MYICVVKKEQIEIAFNQLGKLMIHFGKSNIYSGFELGITEEEYNQFNELILRQKHYNGWFTEDMVRKSLLSLGGLLTKEKLSKWTNEYEYQKKPKTVAVIMAGNIPLVGFHDFVCCYVAGFKSKIKLSSDDDKLFPALLNVLNHFDDTVKRRVEIVFTKLKDIDGIIATGSNNTSRYFEQYFGKYPNIIRKSRTSVAVLFLVASSIA